MGLLICLCGKAEEASDYEAIGNYEGDTRCGRRHGKGVYYYQNGDMFDGQWNWGKKHGHGIYTYANGKKEMGYFHNDKFIGQDPGYLFAEETKKESNPAKPLNPPNPTNYQSREEEESQQALLNEKIKRRDERQKKREEIRKKYKL